MALDETVIEPDRLIAFERVLVPTPLGGSVAEPTLVRIPRANRILVERHVCRMRRDEEAVIVALLEIGGSIPAFEPFDAQRRSHLADAGEHPLLGNAHQCGNAGVGDDTEALELLGGDGVALSDGGIHGFAFRYCRKIGTAAMIIR